MIRILAMPLEVRLAVLFVVGMCVGSLVNLGIYRLAWHRRAISPWSRPDAAAPPRRWFDRLPVLGWLGLRRESPLHGHGFWIRPLALELLCGAAFAAMYGWEVAGAGLLSPQFRDNLNTDNLAAFHHQVFAHLVLISLLLVASWIDFDEKIIPDAITVLGAVAGLVIVTVWPVTLLPDVMVLNGRPLINLLWLTSPSEPFPWRNPAWTGVPALALGLGCFCLWCAALLPRTWHTRHGRRRALQLLVARLARDWTTYAIVVMGVMGSAAIAATWYCCRGELRWSALLSGLVGMAIGGGLIWIVRVLGTIVLRREAMGFGDVTLMAMIGAFLGWQPSVIIFFLAPFAALVIGLTQWILHGESEVPYGPFLALAAVATIVAWAPIWGYLQGTFALGWVLLAVLAFCLALMVVLLPLVRWFLGLFR